MKPRDPKINELLNQVLRNELTAINQYFLHANDVRGLGLVGARQARAIGID